MRAERYEPLEWSPNGATKFMPLSLHRILESAWDALNVPPEHRRRVQEYVACMDEWRSFARCVATALEKIADGKTVRSKALREWANHWRDVI